MMARIRRMIDKVVMRFRQPEPLPDIHPIPEHVKQQIDTEGDQLRRELVALRARARRLVADQPQGEAR